VRRRTAPLVLAAMLAVLLAGCGTGHPAGTARGSVSPVGPGGRSAGSTPADPHTCAAAHQVINAATASFTAEVEHAMAAQDAGDTRTRDASVERLRRIFADWSASLTSLSTQTNAPAVQVALAEYAGAVTATIDRVHSAADLETLASFDDQPLDLAADKLTAVCP
jgi:hypothetical protein